MRLGHLKERKTVKEKSKEFTYLLFWPICLASSLVNKFSENAAAVEGWDNWKSWEEFLVDVISVINWSLEQGGSEVCSMWFATELGKRLVGLIWK